MLLQTFGRIFSQPGKEPKSLILQTNEVLPQHKRSWTIYAQYATVMPPN
jgi:hypothetical protein